MTATAQAIFYAAAWSGGFLLWLGAAGFVADGWLQKIVKWFGRKIYSPKKQKKGKEKRLARAANTDKPLAEDVYRNYSGKEGKSQMKNWRADHPILYLVIWSGSAFAIGFIFARIFIALTK